MKAPLFRTAYDTEIIPDDSSLSFDGEVSLTIQSERDNCDVNRIVERFEKTGVLPVMSGSPLYGDFSELPDYRQALDVVNAAQNAFASLDAKIRKEFDNNPAIFLDFVNDPKNIDKLREMGLAKALPSIPVGDTTTETAKAAPSA